MTVRAWVRAQATMLAYVQFPAGGGPEHNVVALPVRGVAQAVR